MMKQSTHTNNPEGATRNIGEEDIASVSFPLCLVHECACASVAL